MLQAPTARASLSFGSRRRSAGSLAHKLRARPACCGLNLNLGSGTLSFRRRRCAESRSQSATRLSGVSIPTIYAFFAAILFGSNWLGGVRSLAFEAAV